VETSGTPPGQIGEVLGDKEREGVAEGAAENDGVVDGRRNSRRNSHWSLHDESPASFVYTTLELAPTKETRRRRGDVVEKIEANPMYLVDGSRFIVHRAE
jgi:hypothetical protein